MVQSIDEVEDLTRFADESFDTDAVDLFEFTGNEDSPLTRLKSVILSLDWEITDDILDELIEEVSNLRSMWEGDKVAQVYLQGMDKVGRYLKVEGAYAHHNAIKLLLTLFYNYEKIISSPDISGDTITTLLKSDIRKFKVLQYQIGMKGGSHSAIDAQIGTTGDAPGQAVTDDDQLTALEAAILSLDWEVTDEGLMQFHNQATQLNDQLTGNSHARILVQGLQAIGGYISDEKANAHPDAFTLLHSFYEGLKSLVTDKDLESERRQEIVIDQVSRLNSLKEIIAGTVPAPTVERTGSDIDKILDLDEGEPEQEQEVDIDEIIFSENEVLDDTAPAGNHTQSVDELDIEFSADQPEDELANKEESVMDASPSSDDEFDLDIDIEETVTSVNAAMETADEQYPDEVLDPAAIKPLSNEIADEFIEEELNLSSKWRTEPHEADKNGLSLEPDDTPLSKEELDDELELLFDEGLETAPGDSTSDDNQFEEIALGFDSEDSSDDDTDSTALDMEEALTTESKAEADDLDFGDELFLSEDEETLNQPDKETESITPALADTDEDGGFIEEDASAAIGDEPSAELEDKLDSFFGLSEDEETETALARDSVLGAPDDEAVSPALADAEEEEGFREEVASAGLTEESSSELEDKLDTFFDLSDDAAAVSSAVAASSSDLENVESGDDGTVVAALADETTDGGFSEEDVVAELNEDPTDQLQDKLDSFFGDDDEQPQAATAAAEDSIPLEEDLDSFFTDEETTPALSDAEEVSGFDEADEVSGLADSAMDEIDDKLDSFFDLDSEESSDAAVDVPALSSLQAAASALSSAPDSAQLQQQVSQLVTTLKTENHGTNHTILLTMIETAVELLSRNNTAAADTGSIVQELAAGLEDADNPSALIDMVCRYTEWQKEFFDRIVNTAQKAAPPVAQEEVIDQVQSGFSELRGTLMNEFDAIRKELKKE